MLYVLNVFSMWMYQNRRHVELVPLTQTCRAFLPRATAILDHLDNTVRVVERCATCWDDGFVQVYLWVCTGLRARSMRRRNQQQPLDVELLEDLGYLPSELVDALRIRGTRFRPGRSTRAYPTPHGTMEVEEMEALIRFLGGHYAYFNLTCNQSLDRRSGGYVGHGNRRGRRPVASGRLKAVSGSPRRTE